ncbi:MAG: DEAD/DEAH box helicase family protein [Dermatophilaceae bacterium]|nr:DEAD/DEAH box helicase family protein [Dermatophilaceae bacterium]
MSKHPDRQTFATDDLILSVRMDVDRQRWDESRYEMFLDELCGDREYQKNAIKAAARYLAGGEYRDLKHLAETNFQASAQLQAHYGTWGGMRQQLQLPDQLSASLDLATGTGKSYVLYGLSILMLTSGVVDQVLVLCPSITIETQLIEKFRHLASLSELSSLLPAHTVPRIIDGSSTIVHGSICVENYHAILEKTGSSVRDSLRGKGQRTLVLNDEAHHIANSLGSQAKKWKEFLLDPSLAFGKIIGVSGTCYVGNGYFADVIYRYSLRAAIEEHQVKKIEYVAEMPKTKTRSDLLQLYVKKHELIGEGLRRRRIKPLTIIVTDRVRRCEEVAGEITEFLMSHCNIGPGEASARVIAVYNGATSLGELQRIDTPESTVEWVVSVSMLNEGWDVKRVFQIIPHEERAFNSKLLISQVLGRGLRVPSDWKGSHPVVTVFNHESWAPRIRHLVNEILEIEKRLSNAPVAGRAFHFVLHNIEYLVTSSLVSDEETTQYRLLEKGFVDLASERRQEDVVVEFERTDQSRHGWQTTIERTVYTTEEVAVLMYQRLQEADSEAGSEFYTKQLTPQKVLSIVQESLRRIDAEDVTESMRQRFLQALGTLRRKRSMSVRYKYEIGNVYEISTTSLRVHSVGASELRYSKTLFYVDDYVQSIPPEQVEFFNESTEQGSGFKVVRVSNGRDFKTPTLAAIADSSNERKFLLKLLDPLNISSCDAWVKSPPSGFYEIEYNWKKGTNPKKGRFSPDFFLKCGRMILVVEIKDEEELSEPSVETTKKYEFSVAHFERLNSELAAKGIDVEYKVTFLTERNFSSFFQELREHRVARFRSEMDVRLTAGG